MEGTLYTGILDFRIDTSSFYNIMTDYASFNRQ